MATAQDTSLPPFKLSLNIPAREELHVCAGLAGALCLLIEQGGTQSEQYAGAIAMDLAARMLTLDEMAATLEPTAT
jgi:hypothetical protein